MRPANIVTAFADILAGFAAAGGLITIGSGSLQVEPNAAQLSFLLVSTFGLYGGGVVFNDIFDANLDAKERPERPIPSGRVSKTGAISLGSFLLLVGIFFGFQVNTISGLIATGIVVLVLLYDKWAKHSTYWGPVFMGACRGGNLLLGISIIPLLLVNLWFLFLIPLAYIAAITLVSQGEVHGGNKTAGFSAVGLIVLVLIALTALSFRLDYTLLSALPYLILFGIVVLPSFIKAARIPEAELIRTAIKRGVLSLIILNSTLAAGFAGIIAGLFVLILLPISILLSKLFSVT